MSLRKSMGTGRARHTTRRDTPGSKGGDMRVHIFKAQGNLYGFTRDPSGANLPADRGAWTAFKAIEIFEDHPAPRLGVVELAEECSRKRNY
jgi:hypothetical protein